MAGLGAAFLFVPLFYYLGVPLAEATPVALLLNVVEIKLPTPRLHAFDTIICAECGEVTVERYAIVKQDKIVCQPCAEKV